MIKIRSTSVPYNQPLTNQETEAAVAVIDFTNECFESLGLGIGPADLQVIKHPDRGYPQFCPQSRNSELPCDQIYLDMDSLEFWCQLIFQASHEFTHCVIHRLNSHELNDPYDGSSVMGNDFPEPYLGELGKEKTREVVQETLSDEKIEASFKEEKWLDFLVPYVLEDISDDQKEQTIKELKRIMMDFWERAHKDFNEIVRMLCRVTCFTTKQDNLPMWNFYADGYKGVVLEYETAKIERPFLQNCLFPVFYSKKMPDVIDPKLKMLDCFN